MSNVRAVDVRGWMPFNVSGHDGATRWLGIMNGPSYGLRISYGEHRYVRNARGGQTAQYEFRIAGEEAISFTGVVDLVSTLVDAGCVIEEARSRDLEFDPRNTQWSTHMKQAVPA